MREEMPIGFGFALAENEKAMSSFAKMTESGGRPWKIRRIKNKRTGVDSQR